MSMFMPELQILLSCYIEYMYLAYLPEQFLTVIQFDAAQAD